MLYLTLPGGYTIGHPTGFKSGELTSLGAIINSLMDYVLGISGIILLFMIISSGYSLLTSVGNPESISKAKSRLTSSLVGLVLVIAAFWILQIVEEFLGIPGTFSPITK